MGTAVKHFRPNVQPNDLFQMQIATSAVVPTNAAVGAMPFSLRSPIFGLIIVYLLIYSLGGPGQPGRPSTRCVRFRTIFRPPSLPRDYEDGPY